MWQAWTSGLLGLWLFIAAFLPLSSTGVMWDNLIVGIVVAVAGFMMIEEKKWQGWTAGFMGIWLLIAAFIPELQAGVGNMWNAIIVGVIFMAAGFGALDSHESHGGHQVTH